MRIKKTSETTPTTAEIVNANSNSTTDTYSCDYINKAIAKMLYTELEYIQSDGNQKINT